MNGNKPKNNKVNKADIASVQSLEEKVGDGFEDVTEKEIRALFN